MSAGVDGVLEEARTIGDATEPVSIDGQFAAIVVLVPPALASKWLEERNTKNIRTIAHGVVGRYADDMLAGRWNLTHQGIAFNSAGELIDGQHRLAAIVRSGVAVATIVFLGMVHVLGVDEGRRRSAGDVFGELGLARRPRTAAMIARGGRILATGCNSGFSHQELERFYTANRTGIDLAAELHSSMPSSPRGLKRVAPFVAIAAAVVDGVAPAVCEEFASVLGSGVPTSNPGSLTVVRLRNMFVGNSTGGTGAMRQEALRSMRVIAALIDGENLTKLYLPERAQFSFRMPEDLQIEFGGRETA